LIRENIPLIEFVFRLFGMETSTLNNLLKPIFEGTFDMIGRCADMKGGFRYSTRNSLVNIVSNGITKRVVKHTNVANSVPFTTWPFGLDPARRMFLVMSVSVDNKYEKRSFTRVE